MLSAYRVLDLADSRGQFCGRILADLGCQVVKIEPPGGDPARRAGPFYRDEPKPEYSLSWLANNRGKKSLALDIHTPQGQQDLREMAANADVLIESWDPGYMDSLGLAYRALAAVNPGLVVCSITPFGQDGPYRDYKGPDIVVSALGGFMGMNGEPDRAPLNSSVPLVFPFTCAHAAQGILLALYHRDRTGRGQHVDACAMQSMASLIPDLDYWPEYHKVEGAREGNYYTAANGVVRSFISPCKDGHVCFFLYGGAHGANSNRALQERMESEGMHEPALQGMVWEQLDLLTATPQYVKAICDAFDRFFLAHTKAELQQFAVEKGVLMAPCCNSADLLRSPQLAARDFWAQVEHPELGSTITYTGSCVISNVLARNGFVRAPLPDEHRQEVQALLRQGNAARTEGPARAGATAGADAGATAGAGKGPPVGPGTGPPAAAGAGRRLALDGLKVLDFTQAMAGPLASRLLADQGATVVHVESETKIDIYRVTPPYKEMKPGINRSTLFGNYQAGKFGLALDMRHPAAIDVARRLVEWADVIVDSRSPGVLEKWGFGYDELIKTNPDIILARLTNQGTEGPWSRHPAYGTQVIGQAGMIGVVGWPDRAPLMFGRSTYADLTASSLFTNYVLAAILHWQKTGKGQYIDASMVECCTTILTTQHLDFVVNGREMARTGNRQPDASPHGAFPCQGGDRWCAIAATSDQEWQSLCRVMGSPGLAEDPRFASLAARKQNEDQLEALVGTWTRGLPAIDVMTRLQAAGVPAGMVNDFRQLWEEPHLAYRQNYRTLPHSEMGTQTVISFPFLLSETPCTTPRGAPCLGEHNEYVLCQMLGYSDEEFTQLYSHGVCK